MNKLISDLIQSISKAGKTINIYPESSPVRKKVSDELRDRFSKVLNLHEEIVLRIKQFEITCNDEVVYSNSSKEESLAFKLYIDGLREIIFSEGLDENEILGFISVITKNYQKEGHDNDIVTMLWEKDFKNIHYTAVDYRGEETSTAAEPEPHISGSKESSNFQGIYRVEMSEEKRDSTGKAVSASGSVELEIEAIYNKPFNEIFILTQEEIEKIQQEMEMEEGLDLIAELQDILFHILQIEKALDIYSEMVNSITDTIKSCVLAGDFSRSIPVLATLKTLSIKENNFSTEHAIEVHNAVDSLGDEKFLNQLLISINTNKLTDLNPVFSFLTMLNKNAIESLINLAGTVEQMKIRRLSCDALAQLAGDDIEPLIKRLDDTNHYLVRNVVYVLGKIGNTDSIKYLRRIKGHEDPKVRKELIHAFSEINSDDAKDVLIFFLEDEDSSVRISALRNIAIHAYRKAVPAILNIITGEGFEVKDASEKKELFETLGILGSQESLSILPVLKEMLLKRARIFGKTKVEEQRTLSAIALKKMATPDAIAVLKEGLLNPDRGIRNICEEILNERISQ